MALSYVQGESQLPRLSPHAVAASVFEKDADRRKWYRMAHLLKAAYRVRHDDPIMAAKRWDLRAGS